MSDVPAFELDSSAQEWWNQRYEAESVLLQGIRDSKVTKFYRFGHGKQLIPPQYYVNKNRVKDIEIRKDDVWIYGFPRSGTTLAQEMVWLLDHDLDFETAKKVKLNFRSVYIDGCFFVSKDGAKQYRAKLAEENFDHLNEDLVLNMPSPRHLKTHMFFELLPDKVVDTANVIYLAREVKDVIVSNYHFDRMAFKLKETIDFKSYCLEFLEDRVLFGPYFYHLKDGWSKRNHPNVLFLFYEDIIKDLPAAIRRVSKFLGKNYSDEQFEKLHQHLRFDNMQKNNAVNRGGPETDSRPFIRQGKSGTWREYFDDELLEKTEAWIAKNLGGTDIKYPNAD